MVVLADEVLESFFETDLSASFKLVPLPEMELPTSSMGSFAPIAGFLSSLVTDDNKKMFNYGMDKLGTFVGAHQVREYTFCLCDPEADRLDTGHPQAINRQIYEIGGTKSPRIAPHANIAQIYFKEQSYRIAEYSHSQSNISNILNAHRQY